MARNIKDSVIVITGASSGIGRATALLFAEQGAKVVLAARNEEALNEVATACGNLGGEAVSCRCDVSNEEDVKKLAQRAMDEYGRIDVWVNNAAITLFGRFEETPPEDWRKVLETNLFGYVSGARAVLPHFREQQSGVLINVSSVIGKVAFPYVSAYTTSKFAIRGFAEALRMELRRTNIRVCTVYPASIDTPLFQHGGNYYGKAAKPPPPVYRPELVAAAILACARRPRPEISVGTLGQGVTIPHMFSKRLYDQLVGAQVEKEHFQDKPAPHTTGNLYEPDREWTSVSGDWITGRERHIGKGAGVGALLALLVPAALLGYFITQALRPRQRTMYERVSQRLQPPSRTTRLMRSIGERTGLRTPSRRERISDRATGIGTAILASGLATHLRKGQLRSALSDVHRYGHNLSEGAYNQYERGERLASELHERGSHAADRAGGLYRSARRHGSDLGERASELGSTLASSRAGRAVGLPRRARREAQRRYCPPSTLERIRRTLGV
jgi:NAD(P)-dependent dehydrogenase (short-subunit alcohol dehydrogenase family)